MKILLLCLITSILSLSCLPDAEREYTGEQGPPKKVSPVRVGLVLSHFGLGDQSYNDMQYNGLIEAYIKYDINASFRVPKSDSPADIKIAFDELINGEQCNLIIAGEAWVMKDLVLEYANKIQNVDFIVLDYHFADRPNIITALFAQEQGSYAAGYLAARFSRSGRIGFIGGVDVPIVKEFETGFDKGARRGRADALIHKTYISRLPDFSGFVSPKKGYDQAINMYEAGVDIIFAVAGTTGNGVIQAARERGRYVIGVDSNQDHLAPGTVLTSMMKRLDRAIISLVGLKIQGRLRGGIHNFTYANGGISLTEMEFTRKMIPGEILTGLRSVEQELGATE